MDSKHLVSQLLPGGKIPYGWLEMMTNRFINYSLIYHTEVQVDIMYDPAAHAYWLDIPKQHVGEQYVIPMTDLNVQRKNVFVGSIHSHQRFAPYPSATDNLSEVSPHIYGRFGNYRQEVDAETVIDEDHFMFRTCVNDRFYDLNLWDIFEKPTNVKEESL